MNDIQSREFLGAIREFFNLKATTNPLLSDTLTDQLAIYDYDMCISAFMDMTKTSKEAKSIQAALVTFKEYYFKAKDREEMNKKLAEDKIRLTYSAFEGEKITTCNVGKYSPEAEAFKVFNILAHFGYINVEMGKDSTFTHKECSKSVRGALIEHLKGKTVCDLQSAGKIVNGILEK